jgi:hypothetical protein
VREGEEIEKAQLLHFKTAKKLFLLHARMDDVVVVLGCNVPAEVFAMTFKCC